MVDRKVEPAEWVSWAIIVALALALVASLALTACDAGAQTVGSFPGKRLANGDALLVAGIESPVDPFFDATVQVCWRTRGASPVELGCAPASSFVAVGNEAFQAGGQLHTIQDTLPPNAQNVNLVAFLVVDRDAAFEALARAVDDDGVSAEREDFQVFAAFTPAPPPDPGPKAPILLLLDELESAIERVRDQLADAEQD